MYSFHFEITKNLLLSSCQIFKALRKEAFRPQGLGAHHQKIKRQNTTGKIRRAAQLY